jgi:hypothetical protein
MAKSPEAVSFEIGRLHRSLVKIEYKSRRLFQEHKGNPPQDTVISYRRIMEVDARNLKKFKKELEMLNKHHADSY